MTLGRKHPKPGRLTVLPPTTTLEMIVEVCERQIRNINHNLYDCADCQDCSESEVYIYTHQQAEWAELAADVRKMIEKQKKKAKNDS